MKKILLLIFGFYSLGYSQVISDAEILLNKVSDNIKSYDNIYINYAYTLKNLEEDPGGIGPAMSLALLTTLYGAILANGALIPMAQKLENHAKREALNNELIIEGVVFIQKGGNPRLLGDLLSSFLSPKVNKKRLAAEAN